MSATCIWSLSFSSFHHQVLLPGRVDAVRNIIALKAGFSFQLQQPTGKDFCGTRPDRLVPPSDDYSDANCVVEFCCPVVISSHPIRNIIRRVILELFVPIKKF
uniref:(northern house mosquito) hypothetical protein n=1 Tax=Culex pipiens TaxID=7175 RepID=A0A8D8JS63_CULPI